MILQAAYLLHNTSIYVFTNNNHVASYKMQQYQQSYGLHPLVNKASISEQGFKAPISEKVLQTS